MLRDAPDYSTGRIYGPTGQATPSFPVSGTYVTLSDFQKWQSEAMAANMTQSAAALAAAYSAIGVAAPSSIAPASAGPPVIPASTVMPSATPAPAGLPWYVYGTAAFLALLAFGERK